jgi:hypothetical protein
MALAFPILQSQIEVANKLQEILAEDSPTDRSLCALKQQFPGFDADAVLLKASAINQLYATNVWAIGRMAKHVTQLMRDPESLPKDHLLVERLAALPKAEAKHSERNYLSFASKFAHFFIDENAFPIYDAYSAKMTAYHLGRRNLTIDRLHPYRSFVQNFQKVRSESRISCTTRELDSYLWLAGLYGVWKVRGEDAKINADVYRLFSIPSESINACWLN